MPSVFIPLPAFANVPFLPGVPQMIRNALFQPASTVTISPSSRQAMLAAVESANPLWGVFDANGNRVLFPDSVLAFSDRAEWKIARYPQQPGAFQSYNKVITPAEDYIQMGIGETRQDRRQFLRTVDNIAGDTNLYTIVTPEKSYLSRNVTRYELSRRSVEGAYYIVVDLYFEQILTGSTQYSSTQANTANAVNPAAIPAQNFGNVQLQPIVPTAVDAIVAQTLVQLPL